MTSGPSASDVAGAVTAAARSLFVSRGYARTTMKSVATAAGVAPSIVSSMYRNKEQLFTAAMHLPFDPIRAIPLLVAPGLDGMGERIVRLALGVMSDDQVRKDAGSVVDAARGFLDTPPDGAAIGSLRAISGFVQEEVIDRALAAAGVSDARMRGALVSAYLAGVLSTRYVVRLEPLASASDDDVVALVGPVIQQLIDPTVPLPAAPVKAGP
jgi:AcrR family transcriptional regulator